MICAKQNLLHSDTVWHGLFRKFVDGSAGGLLLMMCFIYAPAPRKQTVSGLAGTCVPAQRFVCVYVSDSI